MAFLRAAVRRAVDRSSARIVAVQSGISTGAVHSLLKGGRGIYGITLTKLRSWYLREWAAGGDGLAPDAAAYLIEQVIAPIDAGERRGAALELVEALERIYGCRGTPRPAWLNSVRNQYR